MDKIEQLQQELIDQQIEIESRGPFYILENNPKLQMYCVGMGLIVLIVSFLIYKLIWKR